MTLFNFSLFLSLLSFSSFFSLSFHSQNKKRPTQRTIFVYINSIYLKSNSTIKTPGSVSFSFSFFQAPPTQ